MPLQPVANKLAFTGPYAFDFEGTTQECVVFCLVTLAGCAHQSTMVAGCKHQRCAGVAVDQHGAGKLENRARWQIPSTRHPIANNLSPTSFLVNVGFGYVLCGIELPSHWIRKLGG
jgi:hypothetical protein